MSNVWKCARIKLVIFDQVRVVMSMMKDLIISNDPSRAVIFFYYFTYLQCEKKHKTWEW